VVVALVVVVPVVAVAVARVLNRTLHLDRMAQAQAVEIQGEFHNP